MHTITRKTEETASSMMQVVGMRARLPLIGSDQMLVDVKIIDARKCWDRLDYLVCPVAGSGQRWVAATSLRDIGH